MKTITIPSPSEVLAMVNEAFPKRIYNTAAYESSGEGDRWRLCHSSTAPGTYGWFGHGSTPEEALEDLKAQVAAHDPMKEAKALLESAGWKVSKEGGE